MYEYVGEKLINFQHINYIYFLFPLMLQIWHPTQNEGKIPGAGQAEREEEEGSRQENNPCGPCLVRTCVNPILSEQEIRKKIVHRKPSEEVVGLNMPSSTLQLVLTDNDVERQNNPKRSHHINQVRNKKSCREERRIFWNFFNKSLSKQFHC